MEEFIKSTKQKIVQLEKEISKSDASDVQKSNMQHTLSKINIFSGDVFDDALKYKNKSKDVYSITKEQILKYKAEHPSCGATHDTLRDLFPEAFETVLEVGKWYKNQDFGYEKSLACVAELHPNGKWFAGFGFNRSGNFVIDTDLERWGSTDWKEATESEVFEALKSEAVKRYKSGDFVNCLRNGNLSLQCELILEKFSIYFKDNQLWVNYNDKESKCPETIVCVFDGGKWAEIIPTITKQEAEKLLNKKIV